MKMKKKIMIVLAISFSAFLFVYNAGYSLYGTSTAKPLTTLSALAVECSSSCEGWDNCTIKRDCDYICVEHSTYFLCGTEYFYCSDLCDLR
jgi:hypothetical protein